MKDIKKITFKQLKDALLKDELEFNQQIHDDNVDGLNKNEFKNQQKELEEDYNSIKDFDDLVNTITMNGLREDDAFKIIISKLVELPK